MKRILPVFPPYQSLGERVWFFALRGLNALTLVFLVLPILVIIPLSFSNSSFLTYPMPGLSLRWYQNLFQSDEWIRAAQNSFIVAPAATVLATVLGTLAAVGLNKAEFRGKGLVMALLISP
ncbi:MAG TPA: ABC transporter permease, partial [Burkholderiaceae bacterium]|nr:ABC transporter permease [Burkholderiaceae bacterium]